MEMISGNYLEDQNVIAFFVFLYLMFFANCIFLWIYFDSIIVNKNKNVESFIVRELKLIAKALAQGAFASFSGILFIGVLNIANYLTDDLNNAIAIGERILTDIGIFSAQTIRVMPVCVIVLIIVRCYSVIKPNFPDAKFGGWLGALFGVMGGMLLIKGMWFCASTSISGVWWYILATTGCTTGATIGGIATGVTIGRLLNLKEEN